MGLRSRLTKIGAELKSAGEAASKLSLRRGMDAIAEPGPEPPVIARLVVEVRSDGSRTIARGALEAGGEAAALEARGTTPAQLAACGVELATVVTGHGRACLLEHLGRRRDAVRIEERFSLRFAETNNAMSLARARWHLNPGWRRKASLLRATLAPDDRFSPWAVAKRLKALRAHWH